MVFPRYRGDVVNRFFIRLVSAAFLLAVLSPLAAFCKSDRFVDSDDYKDKNFKQGILTDYSDLAKGDDIEWVWVSPGVTLSEHKYSLGKFVDATEDLGKTPLNAIKDSFTETLGKIKGDKGALTVDINIYDAQKFSYGKAWIPFAGGHQMQAGLGVEMLIKDKKGRTVAKIRHFAREGTAVEQAGEEVATDIKKYILKH